MLSFLPFSVVRVYLSLHFPCHKKIIVLFLQILGHKVSAFQLQIKELYIAKKGQFSLQINEPHIAKKKIQVKMDLQVCKVLKGRVF